ncbi:MAG: imidazole glycerol phosphate synthase subunit HisH [Candidatus Rifleibacteriota bacterium]
MNYGLGNLKSIENIINHIGGKCLISSSPEMISHAEKLILPGVGAFDSGMKLLKEKGLIEPLNYAVNQNKTPTLGICLGMQLMLERSEEGNLPGLGWIKGEVKKFNFDCMDVDLKIPHMGWNKIQVVRPNPIIESNKSYRFYFTHSYHVECEPEIVVATTNYGKDFVSIFADQNIWGVQFHPEKSHKFGMDLFKNFLKYNA